MIQDIVKLTCKKPVPIEILCKRLACSEGELKTAIMTGKGAGYSTRVRDGYVYSAVAVGPAKCLSFGDTRPGRKTVAGITDLHFGSSFCDEKAILAFLERAWTKDGARVCYVTGDILDGNKTVLLPEQDYVGFDHQAERAVTLFEKAPPFQFVTITGNHDGYFSASIGFDAGALLEERMRDAGVKWKHVGVCAGRARLHGAKFFLWHGAGGAGTRNAVRRILNEKAEALQEATDVLVVGHYHKAVSFKAYPENIHCVSSGCFQRQGSEFTNRMQRGWDVGGMVLSWDLAKDGRVSAFAADFHEA